MTSFTLQLNSLFKVNRNVWAKIIKNEMTYSEPESVLVLPLIQCQILNLLLNLTLNLNVNLNLILVQCL